MLHETEADRDTVLATHLGATFLLFRLAATSMARRKRGRIIDIASMYSYLGAGALPSYSAAKGGIVQPTKSMTIELAPRCIQVNAIAPGWIDTEISRRGREEEAFNAKVMARLPTKRWSEPEELAGAAVFLASPASRLINGVTIPVDGGYVAA